MTHDQLNATIVSKGLHLPSDAWRPASGGTETVFTSRSGVRMLYCYQPSTGTHAYLNVDTDIILTDEEAALLLQL